MALQSFTITIGALTDAGNNGKNYVNNQPVYIKKTNGTLASIYRDLAGASPITQDGLSNLTNSKGQFTFFVEAGDYNAEYQSQVTPITVVGADYFNSRIDETVNQIILDLSTSRGFRVQGTFAAGFTYELPNDVGLDASGNAWVYTDSNALPFTVPAATTPSSPTYTQVTFNQASNISYTENGNVEDALRKRAGYYTLAEAQATDLEVGQYVIITDRGDGLFIVAPNGTQVNGKNAILMSNGFVLLLVKDGGAVDSRWYGTANTSTDNEALQVAINDTSVSYIYVRDYNVSSGGCYVDRNDLIIDCCNETLDFTGVGHAAFVLGEASDGNASAASRVNIEIHNVVTTGDQTAGSYVCFFRKASTCKLVNWRAWWLASAFGGDGTDATYLALVCEFKDLDIRYCTVGVNDVAGSFQGSKFIGGRIEANENYGIETNTTNLQVLGTVIEGNGRNGGSWDGNGYEVRVGGGGSFTMVGGYMERFASLTNKAFINVVAGSTKRINLIGVDFYGQDAVSAHLVNGSDWNTGLLNVSGCNINDCSHICTRGGSAGNWHGMFDYFSDIQLASPSTTLSNASYFEIDRVRGFTSTGNMSIEGILTAAATRVTAGDSDSQNTTFQRYIGDIVTGGAGDWHDVIALTDLQAGSGVGNLLDITFACRQADFRFKVMLDLANATIDGTIDFYAGNWTTSNFRIQNGFLQVDNLPASGRDWNAIIVATRTVFS